MTITELALRDPCRVFKMRRLLAVEGYTFSASEGFGLITAEKEGVVVFYPHWQVLYMRGTTPVPPAKKAAKR